MNPAATAIAKYLIHRGPEYFPGWTLEALEDYVEHHARHKSMIVAADTDGTHAVIKGVMIGWKQKGFDHIQWNWQKPDPSGDVFWWDQFMADSPMIAAQLAVRWCELNPDIVRLPAIGFRNGKLRRYKPGYLWEIYSKAEKVYGHKD